MASARDRSVYEEFTIESADGSKTVDISYNYIENKLDIELAEKLAPEIKNNDN